MMMQGLLHIAHFKNCTGTRNYGPLYHYNIYTLNHYIVRLDLLQVFEKFI